VKKLTRLLLLLLALCILTGCAVRAEDQPSVQLLCLNIGKADCMLLLWRDRAYLIDTGYWQTYPALEAALAQYDIDHLNGVFLTHCHKDHAGGLMSLAASDIAVDEWYAPAIYFGIGESEHPAVLAAAQRGEKVSWLAAGDVIDCGGASLTVLGPLTCNAENENNNSLVMKFDSPQGSILFTGDMKTEEEDELIAAGAFSACDVLKAGHHGDNNATGEAMLSLVRPKAALILTNTQEEEDTPAKSTLKRLAAVNCAVYVSQDYSDAMLLTLKDGAAAVEDIVWAGVPERIQGIRLFLDASDDTLTLENASAAAVSLTGCLVFSSRGEETLDLPDITLEAGARFIIGTKSTQGSMDLRWDDKNVWSQKKRDMAILYDAYGRAVARTDNGLEE